MSIPTHSHPQLFVHFDKMKWSIVADRLADSERMDRVLRIFRLFFHETASGRADSTRALHQESALYRNSTHSVTLYYLPVTEGHADLRLVGSPSLDGMKVNFRVLRRYLSRIDHIERVVHGKTGLAVYLRKPVKSDLDSDIDLGTRLRNILAPRTRTLDLVTGLQFILQKLGFEKQWEGPVKANGGGPYEFFSRMDTGWFGLNISYSPHKRYLPFASLQIDQFRGALDGRAYYVILFVLACLKLYMDDVKPSLVEVAFDFPLAEPGFVLDLSSSIYSRKRSYGWCARRKEPMTSYEDDCSDFPLQDATHYVGKRTDNDFQVAIYRRSPTVRMELRLKRQVLTKLEVDSIKDLFGGTWTTGLLGKTGLVIARPTERAFSLVPPQHHHLARKSLKAFIDKIPRQKKINLSRDLLQPDDHLMDMLQQGAETFGHELRTILDTGGIVIVPLEEKLRSVVLRQSAGDEDGSKSCFEHFFDGLPHDLAVSSASLPDAIHFFLSDSRRRLIAKIRVGLVPKELLEVRGKWVMERFKDFF